MSSEKVPKSEKILQKISRQCILHNEVGISKKLERLDLAQLPTPDAVFLESHQNSELSPRKRLLLKMSGKSIQDLQEYMITTNHRLQKRRSNTI